MFGFREDIFVLEAILSTVPVVPSWSTGPALSAVDAERDSCYYIQSCVAVG